MSEDFKKRLKTDPLLKSQDFLHVHNSHQLTEADLFDTSAIIIESNDSLQIKKMLQRLRRMRYKSFYLKPTFLIEGEFTPQITNQTDGIINAELLPNAIRKVEKINTKIQEIRTVTSRYSFSETLLVKSLQYMHTRNIELRPVRDRSSELSYSFPFISSIIDHKEALILLDVLENASDEGLLDRTIIDRVNLCKSCNGSYHNFREVCPKCSSINLKSIDLIHHFRCAFIGPASDFQHGHSLICPKCDKELRHIGIDYDKPSEIFNCLSCGHQAQQPNMKAHCIDCGEENELEYLKTRAINQYRLTAYGQDIAEHGLQKLDTEKISTTDDQRILPFTTWQIMLRHEIQRVKLKKLNSKVIIVKIAKAILDQMDSETLIDFKGEVLRELVSYIRPVDLITSHGLQEIFVLFPEIKAKEINLMVEVFEYNLNKMIKDNLEHQDNAIKIQLVTVDDRTMELGE